MACNIPSLWYQRIVVNNKTVKGCDLTAGRFTVQNLVNVRLVA
jgi:hypothetical protein